MSVKTFADALAAQKPATGGVSGTFAMVAQSVVIVAGNLVLDYSLGQQVEVTLDQNVAGITLTGMPASGAIMELILMQDATGGRTVTWPAGWLAAGGFRPELPPYPGSVSRILISTAGGRVFVDFSGLDYR